MGPKSKSEIPLCSIYILIYILHIKFHIYVDICIYIFHTQPEEILYIILNNFEHETKFHGMEFSTWKPHVSDQN